MHASLEEDGTVTFQGDSDALISKGRSQVLWMEPARAPWKSQHLETCDWMQLVLQSLDHSYPFATWLLVRETWQFFFTEMSQSEVGARFMSQEQPVREGYFLAGMCCRCLFAVSCRLRGRLGCFARPVFERLHSWRDFWCSARVHQGKGCSRFFLSWFKLAQLRASTRSIYSMCSAVWRGGQTLVESRPWWMLMIFKVQWLGSLGEIQMSRFCDWALGFLFMHSWFSSQAVGFWHFSCADTWAQQRFLQHVIVPVCPVRPVWLVNIYCRALGHTLAVWHPHKFQDSDSNRWSFAACCEPRRAGCTEVQADEQEGGNSHSWPEGEWKMFKEYRWKFDIRTSTCYHCALVLQGSKIVDARGRRLWRCRRGRCRAGHAQAAALQHVSGLQKNCTGNCLQFCTLIIWLPKSPIAFTEAESK